MIVSAVVPQSAPTVDLPPKRALRGLKAGDTNVHAVFILLERRGTPFRVSKETVIHPWLVADETASMELTLYDALGETFAPGDILQLTNGYCALHKGTMKLYLARTDSQLLRVGEFTMRYSEQPNMSAPRPAAPAAPSEGAGAPSDSQESTCRSRSQPSAA